MRSSTSRTMWSTCRFIIWPSSRCDSASDGSAPNRCSALRIGASGLRSSCPSIARNWSLRRATSASASRACERSSRCRLIWYWRSRARSAVRTLLVSADSRSGRSSSITLPNCASASEICRESPPSRVRIRIGRSDQRGCCSTARTRAWCAPSASSSSPTNTAPAPRASSLASSLALRQIVVDRPSRPSTSAVSSASRCVGSSNSTRFGSASVADNGFTSAGAVHRADRHGRGARRSARRGSAAAARRSPARSA